MTEPAPPAPLATADAAGAEVRAALAAVRPWLAAARVSALVQFIAGTYLWLPMVPLWLHWGPRFTPDCLFVMLLPTSAVLMFAGTHRVRAGVRGEAARTLSGLRRFGLGALLVGLPMALLFAISTVQVAVGTRLRGFFMSAEQFVITVALVAPLPVAVWGAALHYRHRAALRPMR